MPRSIREEEDAYYDAMDDAIERGYMCTDCGATIDDRYQRAPSKCDDCLSDGQEEDESEDITRD